MTSISIQDICQPGGYRPDRQRRSLSSQVSGAEQQRRLLTVIQQAQMGLDYKSVIEVEPEIQYLANQVQTLMPAAFTTPQRHLRISQQLQAQLTVDEATHWVHATVNLGYQRGVPKLIDWSVRKPKPNWADSVKLWVAAEHLQQAEGLNLNRLKLVVVALSFTKQPQALVIRWNRQLHRQTQAWMLQQLMGGGEAIVPRAEPALSPDLDISQMPEVAI